MPALMPLLIEQADIRGAQEALLHWVQTIARRNVAEVMALYAVDAILVPTLSNEIGEYEHERRQYFEAFLANDRLRCEITIQKKRISRKLGTVVIGGLYTFTFQRRGVEQVVPARFLFTFEKIDGRWLITGHHSSRLSEAL
jgi:hypothetical protein